MKLISVICFTLLSLCSFSQDTLFKQTLSEVTVKTSAKKENTVAVISLLRNNTSIADGISIEAIKKTPDRTTSDALKRVSGVTIQGDKFVLVRGLSDRYNLASLNKTPLPSTEPDRRAFSFDILPVNLIDNIIVVKSAAANLPGDFSGGLIQISTREVSSNFATVGAGIGWGLVSTSKSFKLVQETSFPSSFPSTYTYRTASLGDRRAYTSLIQSPGIKQSRSLPNLNSSLAAGVKKGKIGAVGTLNMRTTNTLNYIDRRDYQSSTELAYQYKDTSFSESTLVNGLLNLNYYGRYKASLKTIFNRQIERSYLIRNGENYDNVQDVRSTSSNTISKTLLNTQFETKVKDVDFNLGYNLMLRDQPDYRVTPIAKSLGVNEPYSIAWRDTYRFWSVLSEHSFNSNIGFNFNEFKLGAGYVGKMREFKARVFRYESLDLLNEITNNTDRYSANFDLANMFVMYDKDWDGWKLNAGLRTEYNLFKVQTADFSGQKITVDRRYLDVLPSLNVSYSWDKVKYRVAANKSLARPEFREVANFAYYDFVRNAQLLGNPNLKKTDIYNLDTKLEYYPSAGENISVAGFFKHFINPIEQIVADGSVPSNLLLTYTNPEQAFILGIEVELRKKITPWLDIYTNSSLSKSSVNINGQVRQLQGQSNYVLNGGLNFHKAKHTLNLSYNRVGDRISAVGFQGYSDIFENSRNIIDVVYLRKLKQGELKLAVGDILAQPTAYYQQNRGTLIKVNNEQTISLTFNFNL